MRSVRDQIYHKTRGFFFGCFFFLFYHLLIKNSKNGYFLLIQLILSENKILQIFKLYMQQIHASIPGFQHL